MPASNMLERFRRVGRISRVMRELGANEFTVSTLVTGRRERAEDELLDLVMEDPALTAVLSQVGSTADTVRATYRDLQFAGAGQWVGGVYVSAAALLKPETLAFVLQQAKPPGPEFEEAWSAISFSLIEYFRTKDQRYLSDPRTT